MEKLNRNTVPAAAARDDKLDEIVEWINKHEKEFKLLDGIVQGMYEGLTTKKKKTAVKKAADSLEK